MKKVVLFFVITAVITTKLIAQSAVKFNLKPNEPAKKEISITGSSFGSFDVLLELRWEEENNRIRLIFDRINLPGEYILCLPLMEKTQLIKNIESCRSKTKSLWNGKTAKDIKQLNYFMESEDLKKSYEPCYKSVAPNNELEDPILFDIIGHKEKITASFNGLYVLKNEKKFFSKRDMKIECKAEPIHLEITLEKKRDPCSGIAYLVNDLEVAISRLETLKSDAETAKKAKKCSAANSELNKIKNNRMVDFPEDNPEWNNYAGCQDISNRINKYKAIRNEILNIQCETGNRPDTIIPPLSPCNLEKINERLFSLQLSILSKKVSGEKYDAEKNEFYEIKNKTKVTPGCKGIDAYNNYCKNIEKTLNNQ